MDWSKLRSREKKAILLLGAAVFFGAYMKFVDQPINKKVAAYKTQIDRSQAQLRDLSTKLPQDVELAGKIRRIEEDRDALENELEIFEKQVPSKLYTSQLVGEFTRLAKEVKLESVKQKVVKEQTYSRIFLEVRFYSTYINAVKYLAAMEAVSPFIRVEEFEILEPVGKTIELGGAPVKIVMSCLLSDSDRVMPLKTGPVADVTMKRDILASASKPADMLSDSKFVLEGITFDANNPTAIINGDVFKVNSEFNGYKVKQIMADSVILNDGVEDHLLSLKPATESVR